MIPSPIRIVQPFSQQRSPEHPKGLDPRTMLRLSLDWETFYSKDYSLNDLSPAEYILDPRFHAICCGARLDTHPLDGKHGACTGVYEEKARCLHAADMPRFLASIPWERTALVSHQAGFDGAILAWRYGFVPALYIDTLALARAFVHAFTGRSSLARVAAYLNLPAKGIEVENARGWTLQMFLDDAARGGDRLARYMAYCARDTDLTSWVCDILGSQLPVEEFSTMDQVARMITLPQFTLDPPVLRAHYEKVVADKASLLARLKDKGILDADDPKNTVLQSNDRFAALLESFGVEVPTKVSLTTGEITYALAKNDKEFTALLDHENPDVQALAAARLGVKSTMEETRTRRFISVAGLRWTTEAAQACIAGGATALTTGPRITIRVQTCPMPFPLRYSGAHTHRLSGDWSWNLQNLRRGTAKNPSQLRRSLKAPKGYVVVSADASQIEARIVSTLAGAKRLVEGFRTGEDVYSTFAGFVYKKQINKKDNPDERFVGKTGVLGLGFGMGAPKFVTTCYNQSPEDNRTHITLDLSQRVVDTYRRDYAPEVPQYWKRMDRLIYAMLNNEQAVDGPLAVVGQRILLPNGMWLFYNNIRQKPSKKTITARNGQLLDVQGVETLFQYGNQTKYLFGGKLTENVVQALARICTMSAARYIRDELRVPYHLAGQVHDQLVYIVPEAQAEAMAHVLVHAMRRPMPWLPDLPLEAEAGIGPNLADLVEVKVPKRALLRAA